MVNEKIFQTIFDELSKFLQNKWERLVIYLEHGEEAYSYLFYVKEEGKYSQCFDLGFSEKEILKSFSKIEKIVSKERDGMNEKWTNMTMVIDDKGNMKTDFDYTDLSEGNYRYKKEWKKKYLI